LALIVNGKSIATTEEGFLIRSNDWCEQVCQKISYAHSIELTEKHWEIIHLLRAFCLSENASPAPPSMRHLSREIKIQLNAEKAKSIYLMKLFGSSPAKMAARLAGLPKPKNCL